MKNKENKLTERRERRFVNRLDFSESITFSLRAGSPFSRTTVRNKFTRTIRAVVERKRGVVLVVSGRVRLRERDVGTVKRAPLRGASTNCR